MARRTIYQSAIPSVAAGDQAQLQCDDEGNLKVASGSANVIDVTLVADTSIYANNDLLAVPQVVSNVASVQGGRVELVSACVIDEDDQGTAIDLVFLSADGSLGTINGALNPTDAVTRTILGTVAVAAADFKDYINAMHATKVNLGLIMECASGSRDLYVAAVVRSGTPTYTASGIKLKLAFRRF